MFNVVNSKKQGDVGLGAAISYFVTNGYTVSIPLTDSQDYDLLVDKEDKIYRVQVKTTSYKKKNSNVFIANLVVKGGNRSGYEKKKKFNKDKVELLFILTESGDKYLIPSNKIDALSHLFLGQKYLKFKVNGV